MSRPWGVGISRSGVIYTAESGRLRRINTLGVINTAAGSGAWGYSGDGGPATAASIKPSFYFIFDTADNLYFDNEGAIRRIDAAGIISTVAGNGIPGYSGDGGPASAAQISSIRGIAFDDTGNLYISDTYNHRIRKVSTAGVITTIAGTGIAGYSGDGGPAREAELNYPFTIAVDHKSNVYFADVLVSDANRIRKVDGQTGEITTIAGTGLTGYGGDGGPATAATISAIYGLDVDDIGNLFLSDVNNNVVRRIDVSGTINTVVGTGAGAGSGPTGTYYGGDGGPATAADLHWPSNLVIDDAGNIYIADNENDRIRKVSMSNHQPMFAGGHTQTISVCKDSSVMIDALLNVLDLDTGQPISWMLFDAPLHGTVSAAYVATSTGGVLSTSGSLYTPTLGFLGQDTLRIRVDDGISADFTTILVTVDTASCSTVSTRYLSSGLTNFLDIQPNPSTDGYVHLTVHSAHENEMLTVRIRDLTGREVKRYSVGVNKKAILLLDLPYGIYSVHAASSSGRWVRMLHVAK